MQLLKQFHQYQYNSTYGDNLSHQSNETIILLGAVNAAASDSFKCHFSLLVKFNQHQHIGSMAQINLTRALQFKFEPSCHLDPSRSITRPLILLSTVCTAEVQHPAATLLKNSSPISPTLWCRTFQRYGVALSIVLSAVKHHDYDTCNAPSER
jgi:hypothetical protein